MNDSHKHCAEQKRPDPKDYILYNSTCAKFQKKRNYSDRKQTGSCQGPGCGERELTTKEYKKLSFVIAMFSNNQVAIFKARLCQLHLFRPSGQCSFAVKGWPVRPWMLSIIPRSCLTRCQSPSPIPKLCQSKMVLDFAKYLPLVENRQSNSLNSRLKNQRILRSSVVAQR